MKYQVQEFVAGKWFVVRAYADRDEAYAHARHIGHKARVLPIG